MNDPKYDVRDGGLWHRQGEYFVPAEEPVMVLRGKDPAALMLIRLYVAMCQGGIPGLGDGAHAASASERLAAFKAYQERYPERTRVGCHNHV